MAVAASAARVQRKHADKKNCSNSARAAAKATTSAAVAAGGGEYFAYCDRYARVESSDMSHADGIAYALLGDVRARERDANKKKQKAALWRTLRRSLKCAPSAARARVYGARRRFAARPIFLATAAAVVVARARSCEGAAR